MDCRDARERKFLTRMVEKYVDCCLDWILEGIDGEQRSKPIRIIHQSGLEMVKQLCALLDAHLIEDNASVLRDTKASHSSSLYFISTTTLLFALANGILKTSTTLVKDVDISKFGDF